MIYRQTYSVIPLLLLVYSPVAQAFVASGVTVNTRSTQFYYKTPTRLNDASKQQQQHDFQHALAILAMPYTSMDRIANEAILETVLPRTSKLSVVLRCESGITPSTSALRRYVGEVYSQLWDCAVVDSQNPELPDVAVYPANLPNAAPESWITIQPDLDCICSHDSLVGWVSNEANGRGRKFKATEGRGGLDEHIEALNSERRQRGLRNVAALHVPENRWPIEDDNLIFVDDDEEQLCASTFREPKRDQVEPDNSLMIGGVKTPQLFDSVAVGGTFDGLHFGHRKLLTLAVSSINPISGRLLVGVTRDEMLTRKEYAEYIPNLKTRMQDVERFIARLAPGMMNRVKIVPIVDKFGPPGEKEQFFDALVLSHETLETGYQLNRHRKEIGLPPLQLLCTRRTEAHGMSSTALRRLRSKKRQQTGQV
jgi:phosphopantetheine adenylyltransferase